MPQRSETSLRPAAAPRFRNLVLAGFVCTGIVTTVLGPILPFLAARWALTDSQAGFYFTALFSGSMIGVGAFSLLAHQRGLRTTLLAGYFVMIGGVALLGASSHRISLLGTFLAGISLGLVITSSNLLAAAGSPANPAAAVSVLNFAWGVGAVSCPFLITLATAGIGLHWFLLLFTTVVGIFFLVLSLSPPPAYASGAEAGRSDPGRPGTTANFAGLALLAALFLLYIGLENSFGGWVASFAHRLESGSGHQQMAQLTPSFFWGALLLGRASAPALLRRFSEQHLVLGGLVLTFLSSLFLLRAEAIPTVMAAVALAGLGCAGVFPILVAWLTTLPRVPHSGLRGVPFAFGNLGGATLPWLIGAISTRFGGLKRGFLVVLVANVLLLALAYLFRRMTRARKAKA